MASAQARRLEVSDVWGGRRLDLFLAEELSLSRSQVRRLLARGAVRLDGRPVAAGGKGVALATGAVVEVEAFARPEDERPLAEPQAPLRVLAEGPGWLAVDKPAGAPVHPFAPEETGSVLGAALARRPEIFGVGEGGLRSGVVHRLDVETSGVLLLASEEAEWQRLRAGFAEHRVEKVYRALVAGRVHGPGQAALGLLLARHRPARVRVARPDERARARGVWQCRMSWRPLEHFARATLLEVRPETGFLHQIRAVLAHRRHPVLGDRTYGDPSAAGAAPRHMLHAASLRFAEEGFAEVAAQSSDPDDFARLLGELRGRPD